MHPYSDFNFYLSPELAVNQRRVSLCGWFEIHRNSALEAVLNKPRPPYCCFVTHQNQFAINRLNLDPSLVKTKFNATIPSFTDLFFNQIKTNQDQILFLVFVQV